MKKLLRKHGCSAGFLLCGTLIVYGLLIHNILQVTVHFDSASRFGKKESPLQNNIYSFRRFDREDIKKWEKYNANLIRITKPREDIKTWEKHNATLIRMTKPRTKAVDTKPIVGYTDDGVPKVVIVGYYRGGTTLTGALFNWNSKALYYFEPLHFLYQSASRYGVSMTYYNGTSILSPSRGHELPYAYEILGGMLSCDFRRVDMGSLTAGMSPMSGSDIHEMRDCQHGHAQNFTHFQKVCLPKLRANCLKRKVRAVKEIRLPMQSAEALLKTFPSLKVIHLLRDSRGRVCSETGGKCNLRSDRIRQVCGKTFLDIKWRMKLEKKYPGRIKMLRYEDLAIEPFRTAESVYAFLNLTFPIEVGKKLYNSTMKGYKSAGMLDVTRPDSIETAFMWRKKIPWDILQEVQKHCQETFRDGRYPNYKEEDKLRQEKLPKRNNRNSDKKYVV